MRRAVFIDRDGVINRSLLRGGRPFAPIHPEDLVILPGVAEALLKLRAAGFLNIVVTNQPDIATGLQRRETLDEMHSRLTAELALDEIRICPHVDADNCACRKPKAGLLIDAAREHNINLNTSCMVGDRWRDIEAGQIVNCECYFINYKYDEKQPKKPYLTVQSLSEAADMILYDSRIDLGA